MNRPALILNAVADLVGIGATGAIVFLALAAFG